MGNEWGLKRRKDGKILKELIRSGFPKDKLDNKIVMRGSKK